MVNETFFAKILLLFLSLNMIYSNFESIKQLNESLNRKIAPDLFQSYIDLNYPNVMENEYKKIRHYESIERAPVRHLDPLEIEESHKSEKIRHLSESNIFYNGISFVQPNSKNFPWDCYWARMGLGLNIEPNLYVYPYPFSHKYNNT